MIDLVSKFLSWIKLIFSVITSAPSMVVSLFDFVGSYLSFLPYNFGSILSGVLLCIVLCSMVYLIVKLVVSLL